jgi:AraC-like DNA-binding protein
MTLPDSRAAYGLLQYLSDLPYFAKDRLGHFTAVNAAFIEIAGFQEELEILGKTDFDIWPRFLAEHYVKDDARVLESGIPSMNRVELVLGRDRSSDWFTTTKVALFNASGSVIGLEGVCRYFKKANAPIEQSKRMPTVIAFIMENYSKKIDIPELAAMAFLSMKQFERNFKLEYGVVPVRYIQRIRLDAARQLLVMTRLPIAQISRETGFYDSSHFSHQFLKYTGFSPKAYREKYPHLSH